MLARGELLGAVLGSLLGQCSAGRAALGTWLAFLSQLPTLHSRRQCVEHFLRTFDGAERHGSQWRATGPRTYVGRQHELRPVECSDPETGEVFDHATETERRHCPAARAGGLSARQGRSPRQLNRYRHALRAAKVMASAQPPAGASDAVRPRRADGSWAYAQHWLVLPPTPEMIRRWRGRTAAPRRDPRIVAGRTYSPTKPPRASTLQALSELAERED